MNEQIETVMECPGDKNECKACMHHLKHAENCGCWRNCMEYEYIAACQKV